MGSDDDDVKLPFGVTTGIMVVVWFCICCCALPFIVLTFVFSITNWDASCQFEEDNPMMKLSVWLLVTGCVNVLLLAVYLICYLTWECIVGVIGYLCVICCASLFVIAWAVVGGVVLFRDSLDCVKDATPLGVWATIIWSLQIIHIIVMYCGGGGSYNTIKSRVHRDKS